MSCVLDGVVVNAVVVVAVIVADDVFEAVKGGRCGAVTVDVVADVEADGPLDNSVLQQPLHQT